MGRVRTSPHYKFVTPLLQVLVAGGADKNAMYHEDALNALVIHMNLDMAATDKEELKRLISLAHGELLSQELTEKFRKGHWKVSRKGVSLLATMKSGGESIAQDQEDTMEEDTPVSQAAEPKTVEDVEDIFKNLETKDRLHLFTAALSTVDACFSKYSPKATACRTCMVSKQCKEASLLELSKLAGIITKEEADAKAAREVEEKAAAERKARQEAEKAHWGNSEPPKPAAAAAPAEGALKDWVRLKAMAATTCHTCKGPIASGEMTYYRRGTGQIHLGCAPSSK